jgi:hypothetical protein
MMPLNVKLFTAWNLNGDEEGLIGSISAPEAAGNVAKRTRPSEIRGSPVVFPAKICAVRCIRRLSRGNMKQTAFDLPASI